MKLTRFLYSLAFSGFQGAARHFYHHEPLYCSIHAKHVDFSSLVVILQRTIRATDDLLGLIYPFCAVQLSLRHIPFDCRACRHAIAERWCFGLGSSSRCWDHCRPLGTPGTRTCNGHLLPGSAVRASAGSYCWRPLNATLGLAEYSLVPCLLWRIDSHSHPLRSTRDLGRTETCSP